MLGIWKYVFFGDQTLCLLIAGAEICRIGVDTAQDTGASDGSVKLRTGIDLLQNLLQLMFNAFVFSKSFARSFVLLSLFSHILKRFFCAGIIISITVKIDSNVSG